MTTRTKTFDCVEMKRNCQKQLREEYVSKKKKDDSYYDYICRAAQESALWKDLRSKQ